MKVSVVINNVVRWLKISDFNFEKLKNQNSIVNVDDIHSNDEKRKEKKGHVINHLNVDNSLTYLHEKKHLN